MRKIAVILFILLKCITALSVATGSLSLAYNITLYLSNHSIMALTVAAFVTALCSSIVTSSAFIILAWLKVPTLKGG